LLPGVHINPWGSGVGVSIGGGGAHVGVTARGQRYTSVGLPGTGVSRRESHKPRACDLCAPGHLHFPGWLALAIMLVAVIVVIATNSH